MEPKTLRPLIRPDALDSLTLVDPTRASHPDWPDLSHQLTWDTVERIAIGETRTWSGVSTVQPPNRLELTGWIWSKKVRLTIRRDPAFERKLARLALSEDMLIECQDARRQRRDALNQGFVVPGLMFWIPGSGEREPSGYGGIDYPGCWDTGSGGGGTGEGWQRPKPQDLVPEIGPVLDGCGLTPNPGGTIRTEVETDHQEILDVTRRRRRRACPALPRRWAMGDSPTLDIQREGSTPDLPPRVHSAGHRALSRTETPRKRRWVSPSGIESTSEYDLAAELIA